MRAWLLAGAAFAMLMAGPVVARADDAAVIEQGRKVAIAADCTACHTKPGGAAFAGGYGILSPFGSIYSTNITPSKTAGIGNYSEDDFRRALRRGIRADGAHLYPAMPYTAYARMTDNDIHALYRFIMAAVPASEAVPPPTKLPFPFNIRLSLAGWNMLFLDGAPFRPDASRSAEWNRGNYLVNALAHCGACHTPRNLLMGEDSGRAFGGAQLGSWFAPNITSDPVSGIGGWAQWELVQYLRTGRVHGKAQAGGGMAEAVENSLQYLGDDDLGAIAVYLRGTSPIRDARQAVPSFAVGAPHSVEPELRGTVRQDSSARVTAGDALYSGLCASCHQPGGGGSRDMVYPSLFHNTATGGQTADNLVSAILFGIDRKVGDDHVVMPRFDGESRVQPLDDQQVAAISNYVLENFGNAAIRVSPAGVAQVRRGGPPSPLAFLTTVAVPGLLAFGVVAVGAILLVLARARRRRAAVGGHRTGDSDLVI